MSRTNTARPSTTKVGTPNDGPVVDRLLVGAADHLHGGRRRDLGHDLVTGHAGSVEHPGHHVGDAEVEPLVVTGGEERDVRIEEPIGVLVTHHHTRGERQQVGRLGRVVPDGRVTLVDVDLAQGEGKEGDVPVGPVGQCDGQVLMGIAGKGAAIVPRDGEWLHSSSNTTPSRAIPEPTGRRRRPRRRLLPG